MMEIISAMLNRKDGKRAKGFTLIELLVVVIIIGILASIAVPIYLNQRKSAWKATVVSDVRNAALVVESSLTETNGSLKDLTFTTGTETSPMLVKDSTGSEIGRSTVSPRNTITTALGTTTAGDACYVITGVNTNISNWTHVVKSDSSCAATVPSAPSTTGGTQQKTAAAFVVLYDKAAAKRQGSNGNSVQTYGNLDGSRWDPGAPAKGDLLTGIHGYLDSEDGTRYWLDGNSTDNITSIDGLSNWSWDGSLAGTWDGGLITFHFKDGHAVRVDPRMADVDGALTVLKEK